MDALASERGANTIKLPFGMHRDNQAGWLAKVLFCSLTCMIVISIFSLANLYLLGETSWWRNHNHETIEQIYSIEQSLADSAAWYQTFRITQDTADLWRSDKELSVAEGKLKILQRETRDSGYQQHRINQLNTLIEDWFSEEYVLSDARRPFLNGLPFLIDMRKEEQRLLLQRGGEMDFIRGTTVYMSIGLLLFSVTSLIFLWRKWNEENTWTRALLAKLHAAETRFTAFMDHSPLLAFITDAESRLVYSNRVWDRSMKMRSDSSETELSCNRIPDQLRSRDREVLETGVTAEFLEKVPTNNDQLCDWLVVRFPFSSNGEYVLLGGLAVDVTNARRTQVALEASEERLRLALRSASMHAWELEIEGDKIDANLPNFLWSDDGCSKKVTFQEYLQVVSPEYRQRLQDAVTKAIKTKSSYELAYRTVEGRWIASSGIVRFDRADVPVRMVGFRQDQTEKIEAEKALAQLTKLHESILKSTNIALISIDGNRVVTSWNTAAERLLGYTSEEVVGHATPDLWLDPDDLEARANRLDLQGSLDSNPFLSKAILHGEDTQECTFRRKDGSKVLVRLTVTPIFNDDGTLFGFLEHATDISEFRRASHQIQELNQALNNTVSGWAQLDNEGRYMRINKSYAETVGYAPEELIGRPWTQAIHPQDLPMMIQTYEAFLGTGRGEALARGLRKDATTFYKHVSLFPAHDYLGNRIGCYHFMRDVTARVEAEQKLETSERRYREFFEMNPLPCWIYDPQTLCFGEVNEAATRHYGYTREQFLAMKVSDIRLPEEASLIEREFAKFGNRPSWTSGPWRNVRRNGSIIEVEIAACNLSERARLVVIRDVTEQRQAELIRKSEAKLQEAQRIARLGSWELDTKSGAVSWSPETYRIFGLEGLAGKFLFEEFLSMIHPEDRDQVASAVRNSVYKKQVYDLQFRIVRENGELRHLHGRGEFSNGSRQCLAGTMLDITEQKQVQDALQQSLDEKEVLLKEVHHRVKNNLQVISCLLNMQAGNIKDEPAIAALHESERRVMAMAVIHERLYSHKRMDRIDFREYAESLAEDLIASYAPSGTEIERVFSVDPIELDIEQAIPCGLILNELITNALKYAFPVNGSGSIAVNLDALPDNKLRLSVSDNGQGLPIDFDWKKSKSLGVTIVNLLTKQLGGDLKIDSSRSGTTFTVLFPKVT